MLKEHNQNLSKIGARRFGKRGGGLVFFGKGCLATAVTLVVLSLYNHMSHAPTDEEEKKYLQLLDN